MNLEEIRELKKRVIENAEKAKNKLCENCTGIDFFSRFKFEKFGFEPKTGTEGNLLEQINQTFTILMSCYAAEHLAKELGAVSFDFAFGEQKGRDLVACDRSGEIIAEAEIFTAIDPGNNRKLQKDIMRMSNPENGRKHYVFFSSPKDYEVLDRFRPEEEPVVTIHYLPLSEFMAWIKTDEI